MDNDKRVFGMTHEDWKDILWMVFVTTVIAVGGWIILTVCIALAQ